MIIVTIHSISFLLEMFISRSSTSASTATLVHAFVTARLDYSNCSTLYVGLPAGRLGCPKRVPALLCAAARLIWGIPRTGHVSGDMLLCTPLVTLPAADHTGSLLWSEGVCWALPRPTREIFAVPPRAPFAQCNVGYYLFHLPLLPQGIPGDWPFRVGWVSVGTAIAPRVSFWYILLYIGVDLSKILGGQTKILGGKRW